MKKYDVIILGGGASGMYCAMNANRSLKIAILDKSDRIGKKILVTGNGRCNITNAKLDLSRYNTTEVDKYFRKYSNVDFIRDMERMGLALYSDEEGRMYPRSNSANSVLDIMMASINSMKNVDVITNSDVIDIAKKEGNFSLKTGREEYVCDKLVVATGGNSIDGVLNNIGIQYHDFVPSLVALNTSKNKGLAGVRASNVLVKCGNFKQQGELLFKENAISGIVVFNLSTIFARNNKHSGEVVIDLLPDFSQSMLEESMNRVAMSHISYTIMEILQGYVHKALARNIIDRCSVKGTTKEDISKVVNILKNYTVKVIGLSDNNQVHSGGVPLELLDDNLMYKDIPNLYFTGEIIDVDGECGGYNLQWAWTSGKTVGDAL
ncbi:MAG: aminoacetone oxidase family FAD-binding enzyme [Clostridiales bacterium]|nr:aminoacetone oxidase family FAD-binding enzyme [Clostridiales bacterium]